MSTYRLDKFSRCCDQKKITVVPMIGGCDAKRIGTVESSNGFLVDLPTSSQKVDSLVEVVGLPHQIASSL